MSNARITEELGWRPRYPTYREALALLDGHERDVAGVGRRTMQRA